MKFNVKNIVAAGLAGVLAISGGVYYNTHKSKTYASGNNVSKILNPKSPTNVTDAWTGNYIWFGHYPQSLKSGADSTSTDPNDYNKDPIKWRVLDNNNTAWDNSKNVEGNGFKYNIGYADGTGGRQNAPVGGNGVLLMSDQILDRISYHSSHGKGNEVNEVCWAGGSGGSGKGCILWAWLNGYDNSKLWGNAVVPGNPFINTAFTDAEKNAIMVTKVYSEDLKSDRIGTTGSYAGSPRTTLSQDKIFLLSWNEALNEKYGFVSKASGFAAINPRVLTNTAYAGTTSWWLRSPANRDTNASAANVLSNGNQNSSGYVLSHGEPGCVSVLNLNLESVIFASKTVESRNQSGIKDSVVAPQPNNFVMPEGYGNEFKLTMKDDSRNFVIDKDSSSQKGFKIKIAYSGAIVGDKEYISCLIVDKKDACEIKYYGKLAKAESASGTVDLTLPSDVQDGNYVIKVFNEQCNGEKETDWASEPVVLEIDANGQVGFPYSAQNFPDVQRIEILPAGHSKSKGAPENGVNVNLTGKNFSEEYKFKLVFKKKGNKEALLTYPENGQVFLGTSPTFCTITIPKGNIESLQEVGKYTVQVEIESN